MSLLFNTLSRFVISFLPRWLFSRSVVSNCWWPHWMQYSRLNCPSLSPRIWTNSRPNLYQKDITLKDELPRLVQFSCSVVSGSLWPHELQHARLPCPLATPGVHSNSRPSSRWCHPAISSSCRPLFLLPPIPHSIRVFSKESTLHMRWPKYWSFSFSIIPSKEQPGLISFRMDWLDLLDRCPICYWRRMEK